MSEKRKAHPDDWFRSADWSDEAQTLFRLKLSRSRSDFHRAQYTKIKGGSLTRSEDPAAVAAGQGLIREVIDKYPHERSETSGAHDILAASLSRQNRHAEAASHLRECLRIEATCNVRYGAELKLARTLVAEGEPANYPEAWRMLGAAFADLQASLRFNNVLWDFYVTFARLSFAENKREYASQAARAALALAENDAPVLSRKPEVGRVGPNPTGYDEMVSLAALPIQSQNPNGFLDWLRTQDRYERPQTEWDIQRKALKEERRNEEAKVVERLNASGYAVASLEEMNDCGDPSAVPVLLECLDVTSSTSVRRDVIYLLANNWAKPVAVAPLANLLLEQDPNAPDNESIVWEISSVLEQIATEEHLDDLLAIARAREFGTKRGLVIRALGRMRKSADRVVPVLVDVLAEPTPGEAYAIDALGRLKAPNTRHLVEPFIEHEDSWVRNKAKAAYKKLTPKR